MEVNKELQYEDPKKVTLSFIRTCFDGLIESFPVLASHLAADADIVYFPDFENAIVKIQRGKEGTLNGAENVPLPIF